MASRLTVLYGRDGRRQELGAACRRRAPPAERWRSGTSRSGRARVRGRRLRRLARRPAPGCSAPPSPRPSRTRSAARSSRPRRTRRSSTRCTRWGRSSTATCYVVLDQTEEYFLYHGDEERPRDVRGRVPGVVNSARPARELPARDPRGRARQARRVQGADPERARQLPAPRASRPRAARAAIVGPIEQYNELVADRRGRARSSPRSSTRCSTQVVDRQGRRRPGAGAERSAGSDGAARVETPYLQLVMHRLWDEERARLAAAPARDAASGSAAPSRSCATTSSARSRQSDPEEKDVVADDVRPPGHAVGRRRSRTRSATSRRTRGAGEPTCCRCCDSSATSGSCRSACDGRQRSARTPRYEIFHDVLAEPVLAWRTRYEAERRVALERAESDRRHRRVLAILGVVVVALAAMTAIAAYAVAQRSEANKQAARATSAAVYANEQRVIAEDQTAIAEAASADAVQ